MLRVTPDQISEITDTRRTLFRESTDAKVLADFSAAPYALEHDEIRARSEMGWSMSKTHGMVSERDHIRYLYLRVALGEDWASAPELEWLRTLFHSDRASHEKLDMAEAVVKSAAQT